MKVLGNGYNDTLLWENWFFQVWVGVLMFKLWLQIVMNEITIDRIYLTHNIFTGGTGDYIYIYIMLLFIIFVSFSNLAKINWDFLFLIYFN